MSILVVDINHSLVHCGLTALGCWGITESTRENFLGYRESFMDSVNYRQLSSSSSGAYSSRSVLALVPCRRAGCLVALSCPM